MPFKCYTCLCLYLHVFVCNTFPDTIFVADATHGVRVNFPARTKFPLTRKIYDFTYSEWFHPLCTILYTVYNLYIQWIFFIDQWEPLKKEIEIARVKENQVKAFRSAQTAFWRGKVFCLFRARLIFQNQAIYTFINPVWLLFFRKLMQALISNDVTWLDPNLDRILPNYVYSQNHGWSFKPSENGLTNVKLLVLFASSDGAPFDFKAPQGGKTLEALVAVHNNVQCNFSSNSGF